MRHPYFIFVGFGWGAPDQRTALGPQALYEAYENYFKQHRCVFLNFHMPSTISVRPTFSLDDMEQAYLHVGYMISSVKRVIESFHGVFFPVVLGGDHSIAMGTWRGIKGAAPTKNLGLLWVDAHMDAHTFQTSHSKAPHGMPLASLLKNDDLFWVDESPILQHDAVAQFCVRDFEPEEPDFLTQQHVSFWKMDEKPFQDAWDEGLAKVRRHSDIYGLSLDIDAFDPIFAPGTGTTVQNGLNPKDFIPILKDLREDSNFVCLEISEINAAKDINGQTLKLVYDIIREICG